MIEVSSLPPGTAAQEIDAFKFIHDFRERLIPVGRTSELPALQASALAPILAMMVIEGMGDATIYPSLEFVTLARMVTELSNEPGDPLVVIDDLEQDIMNALVPEPD